MKSPVALQTWLQIATFSPRGRLDCTSKRNEANKSSSRAKPSHYAISLYDIEFGGKFSYKGTVSINTKITKDDGFSELVLNAHQLKVHSAELKAGDATKSTKDISYDEKRQRVTLDFGEKINHSGEATLEIKFEGTINNV